MSSAWPYTEVSRYTTVRRQKRLRQMTSQLSPFLGADPSHVVRHSRFIIFTGLRLHRLRRPLKRFGGLGENVKVSEQHRSVFSLINFEMFLEYTLERR